MSRYESSSLILRTIDIQMYDNGNYNASLGYVNNEFGSIQSRGQYFSWNNINLKAVLGTMWDKYDMFNLCLKTIIRNPASSANNSQFCSTIWCAGLNFINSTYDIRTKTLTQEACIGGANFVSTATNGDVFHQTGNTTMFKKGNDIVNLTIQLKNSDATFSVGATNNGRNEISINTGGHMELIFDIYGVKGYETNPKQIAQSSADPLSRDYTKTSQFQSPNYVL